jgi:hypothetical protein
MKHLATVKLEAPKTVNLKAAKMEGVMVQAGTRDRAAS